MPAGLRLFATHQRPCRQPGDRRGCMERGIAVASYLWAIRLYNRRRAADVT
jgi:hypothetical protein